MPSVLPPRAPVTTNRHHETHLTRTNYDSDQLNKPWGCRSAAALHHVCMQKDETVMLPLPSLIKCQPYQGWPAGGPWENCGRRFNSVFLKFMCKFYILDKQPSKEFICIVHKYSSVRSMNSVINLGYFPFSGVYFSVETPAEPPHTINDKKRLFKSAGGKKTHIFSSLCTALY